MYVAHQPQTAYPTDVFDNRTFTAGEQARRLPKQLEPTTIETERNTPMWTTTLATRLVSAALVGTLGLGVGGASVAAAAQTPSTNSGRAVDMQIMVQPTAAAPGASFTDTITVANVGQDPARDVAITVPFDPSAVRLLNVQFNQLGAWVTSVTPSGFQADLGRIGSKGQDVQVIASFAALPGYTPANPLPSAIKYSYDYADKTHSGTIDTLLIPMTAAPVAQPAPASMAVTTVMASGTLPVNSAIFAPGESVAFWYNTPSGRALPLYIHKGQITTERRYQVRMADGTQQDVNNGHYLNADAQGAIAALLSTKGIAPGAYMLVAHGLSSDATAVIAFQVE
jgi:hypothetical protein